MNDLSPKERLLRVLARKPVDRPPVVCPGGMMNAAVVEVMDTTGHMLPKAHHDKQLMGELSQDVQRLTGFENFGIPFCMTVEAEVLGSSINFGTRTCEPKIEKEVHASVSEVERRNIGKLLQEGRIGTIVEAGRQMVRFHSDIPLIGSLTGPISTLASVVDPMQFFRELRRDRDKVHQALAYVSEFLTAYARVLVENGASVITIADPTATGEILGPRFFGEYAVPYLNQVIAGIHDAGAPVIVHICGKLNAVTEYLPKIASDAISTDAFVNLRSLKQAYPELVTMGNLSTFLLESGTEEKIAWQTERLARDGIDILSPACGLSTASPLKNIRAMTDTAKERKHAERLFSI